MTAFPIQAVTLSSLPTERSPLTFKTSLPSIEVLFIATLLIEIYASSPSEAFNISTYPGFLIEKPKVSCKIINGLLLTLNVILEGLCIYVVPSLSCITA